MLQLLTVPHSGTRFLQQKFKGWGLRFRHRHFEFDSKFEIHEANKYVITLRDPLLCRISRMNRVGRMTDALFPSHLWGQVVEIGDRPNVHYVRVDQPRKDEEKLLANFCGLEHYIPSGWAVVESFVDVFRLKQKYAEEIPSIFDKDVKTLKELGVDVFFREHGYDLKWMQ